MKESFLYKKDNDKDACSNREVGKDLNRVALIKQEFINLGFWKINETVREKAAQVISDGIDSHMVGNDANSAEVENLVALYQEIKLDEFLRDDYNRLPVQDRLQWLKDIVEKSNLKIQDDSLILVSVGRAGFAVDALLKAYEDKNKSVKDYAKMKLEKIILASKSKLVNQSKVDQIIKEFGYLYKIAQPYLIKKEVLKGTSTILRSFLFNWGCNIYVLSYERNGATKHTMIDTGDRRYKPSILKLFKDNGIEPANIERILLTHHHHDHSGLLDIFCMLSGAKVLVHPDFKGDSIELDMSRFGKYIEWLPPAEDGLVRNIGDVSFPILGEPINIGKGAKLEILGLPKGDTVTHTVDQLMFRWTPENSPDTLKKTGFDFKPTDEVLFSGDLWLIHPPGFLEGTLQGMLTSELRKERRRRFDFRPQNRKEKNALKKGFSLITVKPGHGPEFLGSRIVGTLLAKRDIMVKLGFDEDTKKDILNGEKLDTHVMELKEKSYQDFLDELNQWLNPVEKSGFGYKPDEVSKFLLRIYMEHTGGGELVGQDRKERRIELREKLSRLSNDTKQSEELRLVAESGLLMIKQID